MKKALTVTTDQRQNLERLAAQTESIITARRIAERPRIISNLNRENNAILNRYPRFDMTTAPDQPALKMIPVTPELEAVAHQMPHLYMTAGNSKIGRTLNVSVDIYNTCDHSAPCYINGLCYAMFGRYSFYSVRVRHLINYLVMKTWDAVHIAADIVMAIDDAKARMFRANTAGELSNYNYALALTIAAYMRPGVKFGTYTKVAMFADMTAEKYGTPSNLRIALSPWTLDSGEIVTPFSLYDRPLAVFVPAGLDPAAVAPGAVGCPNLSRGVHCDACGLCYGSSRRNVHFMEHSTGRKRAQESQKHKDDLLAVPAAKTSQWAYLSR